MNYEVLSAVQRLIQTCYTVSKTTNYAVFCDYSGHVDSVYVRAHTNKSGNRSDYDYAVKPEHIWLSGADTECIVAQLDEMTAKVAALAQVSVVTYSV